jgi:predicted ATPase
MVIMHELCQQQDVQFIIATHSPILLAYPYATIYCLDGDRIAPIAYKDTQYYQLTKNFLNHTDVYLKELLGL